jgi:hypothetical protein
MFIYLYALVPRKRKKDPMEVGCIITSTSTRNIVFVSTLYLQLMFDKYCQNSFFFEKKEIQQPQSESFKILTIVFKYAKSASKF